MQKIIYTRTDPNLASQALTKKIEIFTEVFCLVIQQ